MSVHEGSKWQETRENEVTCKGSYILGTACGHCSRCKNEINKLTTKTKFSVKSETLGPNVIANFRVRDDVHTKIKSMAENAGVGINDVVRQMIDFALENL